MTEFLMWIILYAIAIIGMFGTFYVGCKFGYRKGFNDGANAIAGLTDSMDRAIERILKDASENNGSDSPAV